MRGKVVSLAAAVAVVTAVPAVALLQAPSDTGERTFSSTKRAFAFRTTAVTIDDTEFRRVPGLDDLLVHNRDASTARFSGDFTGGPVEVRVVRADGGRALLPGIARFAPSASSTSFSYDFLEPRGRGVGCRRFAVELRSPTGAEVTLNHGSLIVDYRFDDTSRNGLRTVCPD